jgi:putative DNA primase/helicase
MSSTTARPCPPRVNVEAIPDALKSGERFVCWSYVEDRDRDTGAVDWDKPPLDPRTLGPASSTNPRTWSGIDVALDAYDRAGLDGIGIVLHRSADDLHAGTPGLVGIDLDDCRDPQTGAIQPWASEIIREFDSYTEVSPSGAGIRIFVLGKLPPFGRKRGAYENYEHARYVTITGWRLDGTPPTVEHRQQALEAVHRRIFGERPAGATVNGAGERPPIRLDDAELLRKARAAKNGAKFARLFSGDLSGHRSRSEADLALCNYLAFWCGPDPERIADLFAQSGLYRGKWNRPDYRERTIQKAIGSRTEYYDPARNGRANGKPAGRRGPKAQPSANGDGEPEDAHAAAVNEAEDDPHRLARIFADRYRTDDGLTLRWWRGEAYTWGNSFYRALPTDELKARLSAAIKEEFDRLCAAKIEKWEANQGADEDGKPVPRPVARKVTVRLVADTLQALTSEILLPSALEAPGWIEAPAESIPTANLLVCRNGVADVAALAAGNTKLLAPTPGLFNRNALPYDYRPDAPAPKEWLDFLHRTWDGDAEAIDVLQDWFGYCLTADTRQQKILALIGPKRSGKSTIARILRGLVGIENTCGPTLGSLATNFGLWPLLGKSVGIIADARLSGRTDAATVTERLLSISGEDAQTVDRKHLAPVTTTLPTRLVIISNELPRLTDPSGALVGRFVLLSLTKSWYGQEDTKLTDRLLAELPSILLWSIAGWRRLHERGHFVQPTSGRKLIEAMEDLSSPIGAFIRERCVTGPACDVFVRDLWDAWKNWCEEKGKKDTGNEQTFGRDLRAALPSLDMRQPRQGDTRVRVYVGVRLRHSGDAEPACEREPGEEG